MLRPCLGRGWVEGCTAIKDSETRRCQDRALRPFGGETIRAR